MWFF